MIRNTIYALVVVAALAAAVFTLWKHHKRDYVIDPDKPAGAAVVVRNGGGPAGGPLKPTSDLVSIIADASSDKYSPPPDGRLSEAQIRMYLRVREHEKEITQVAAAKKGDTSIAGLVEGFRSHPSSTDILTTDIRAAKDLGYNTQEYLWVKSQVTAASSALMIAKLADAANASFEIAYIQIKKSYDQAEDDKTKKMYREILDTYNKQRADMNTAARSISPSVAHNQQLMSKYDGVLEASEERPMRADIRDPKSAADGDQKARDVGCCEATRAAPSAAPMPMPMPMLRPPAH